MQDLGWQWWHATRQRIGVELEHTPGRLSARRAELAIAFLLTIFFLIAGGLPMRWAAMALAAIALWAALWPLDDTTAATRSDSSAKSVLAQERTWQMLVDAVPEPTVVLDDDGTLLHANRMADELFGARRRGGHVAAMSRDPELLAAVDQALVSGETAFVDLQERVPVERRLLATVAPLDRTRSAAAARRFSSRFAT